MLHASMRALAERCRPLSVVARIVGSILILQSAVSPALAAQPGRWSPRSSSWNGTAIHMALLRGDGSPYHSRIVWWQSEGTSPTFVGGQWGWKSHAEVGDCSRYPDSAMVAISLADPGDNIFCTALTQTSRGQLAVIAGTELGTENGLRKTNIFRVPAGESTGTWTAHDSMTTYRYYPNSTLLADGRVAVFSGSKYVHIELFGGRKDGESSPSDSSLLRFAPAFKGIWDSPGERTSGTSWPSPLTGLTGLSAPGYGKLQYYGGRDQNGRLSDKVWALNRNASGSGADYTYDWVDRTPSTGTGPDPRMDHVAVMVDFDTTLNNMVVFGGLAKPLLLGSESARNEVWRHYGRFEDNHTVYRWKQLNVGGTLPSARLGHTGFFDEDHYRMIMFGGRASTSSAPADTEVWALNFSASNPDTAWWTKPTVHEPSKHPIARYDQSMEPDNVLRKYDDVELKSGVLFGGHGSGSQTFNDVWKLWISADGSVEWDSVVSASTPPSPRSSHTGTYESGSGRLMVFGGENSSGAVGDTVWTLDLDESPTPNWRAFASEGHSFAGQSAIIASPAFARVPEILTEGTNSWSHGSTGHEQVWYPEMFQMTNSNKVFEAGPALDSYTYDPSNGAWAKFPSSSPAESVFVGGNAVMYDKGKVLKVGSRFGGDGDAAVVTTKYIDLEAGSPAWHSSGSMRVGRVNHNLVVLPSGDVLVTGGVGNIGDGHNYNPRKRPEIWSPSTNRWTSGVGGDTLAASTLTRGYHSTAILLPDARILCGGGNVTLPSDQSEVSDSSQVFGDVYCPPYLFNGGGGLATRPTLVAATGRWRYNSSVTFAVNSDTTLRRACLIHAAATTHSQDQAQRYVPLTLSSAYDDDYGNRQYFLTSPADSFNAPPGDYLLFVSDSSRVPSIAQWVRVGSDYVGQFDNTAPDSLATMDAEFITSTALYPMWTAPGDDGRTGIALDYDLRYSTSQITDSNFSTRSMFSNIPIPRLAGTVQSGASATGLSSCTWYYVAGETRDRAEHWSAIGGRTKIKTLCNGGGGGASLRVARDEPGAAPGGTSPADDLGSISGLRRFARPTELTGQTSVRMVGSFTRGEAAQWQLAFEDFNGNEAVLEATGTQLVVQEPAAGGGWKTRSSLAATPGPFGVRSLSNSGRVIFPAGTSLEALELDPLSFSCESATHSRLGDLLGGSTTAPEFASGDTIRLSYTPSEGQGAGEDRVLIPTPAPQSHMTPTPRQPTAVDLPKVFALYPARPNPFSRATTIRFDLPHAAVVKIELFDVQGRRIATLVNGSLDAGRRSFSWDGRTDRGGRAAAGVYLCRMTTREFTAERRMSLLP